MTQLKTFLAMTALVFVTTTAVGAPMGLPSPVGELRKGRVCQALKSYPMQAGSKLSFEVGEINPMCKVFVKGDRASLDRCGDKSDRFDDESTAATAASQPSAMTSSSHYTWPSRNEMLKRGRTNLYADPKMATDLMQLNIRIDEIRRETTNLCCGDDATCRAGMSGVEVSVCKPPEDGNVSDPCSHGGAFEMAGRNYTSIFASMQSRYTRDEDSEFRKITTQNLPMHLRGPTAVDEKLTAPLGGKIVLTSYVKKDSGISTLEPTLYHEFGHACTMVKMQIQAGSGLQPEKRSRALTALKWFDQVKNRCNANADLQADAYADFWESVGESRELAQCFANLTKLNREQKIDKPCNGLCPGHYMEETVGVAFSLLNGDLTGKPNSVFPNTCDHMRDRQHPMVADVMECLVQYSPRFRNKLADAYGCEKPANLTPVQAANKVSEARAM